MAKFVKTKDAIAQRTEEAKAARKLEWATYEGVLTVAEPRATADIELRTSDAAAIVGLSEGLFTLLYGYPMNLIGPYRSRGGICPKKIKISAKELVRVQKAVGHIPPTTKNYLEAVETALRASLIEANQPLPLTGWCRLLKQSVSAAKIMPGHPDYLLEAAVMNCDDLDEYVHEQDKVWRESKLKAS